MALLAQTVNPESNLMAGLEIEERDESGVRHFVRTTTVGAK
jgi:hypothetical protein